MINLNKIKMKPIVLNKKEGGRLQILYGHKRVKVLKIIGVTKLKPDMYNYSDGSYNKDIILMKDIEDEFI